MAPAKVVEDFDKWVTSQKYEDIWEENLQDDVVGMGPMFVQLFTHITNHLNYLNGRNEFNGSLKKSMQISTMTEGRRKWLEVKFNGPINQVKGNDEGDARIAKGIRTDISSLHELVNKVTQKRKLNFVKPEVLTLFCKSLYQAQEGMSLLQVKKIAFYNYSHPIFFDKERRCKFIYKVWEIQKRNTTEFVRHVSLDKPPVDMTGWINKVPLDQTIPSDDINQSPLRQVLYGRRNSQQNQQQQQQPLVIQHKSLKIQQRYYQPSSVPAYLRNVCEHGRDITTNTWSGKLLKELHHALPDALPKIHYALCDIGDTEFKNEFDSSLVKLLRHGAFGYKGFKF